MSVARLSNPDLEAITNGYLKKLGMDLKNLQGLWKIPCPPFLREKRPLTQSPITQSPMNYQKVAIFITGPAASGKSYVQRYIFSSVPDFKYRLYNPDIYVEMLMKEHAMLQSAESGESGNYVKPSPKKERFLEDSVRDVKGRDLEDAVVKIMVNDWKKRSLRAFLSIGKECSTQDYNHWLKYKNPIVIDRPGDALIPKDYKSKSVIQQIQDLKKQHYRVAMIMVYTERETTLARNETRGRSLSKDVVEIIWDGLFKFPTMIQAYQKELKDDFVILDNRALSKSPMELYGKPIMDLQSVREWFGRWLKAS